MARRARSKKSKQLYQYSDFTGFLMAFKAVTEDLHTPDDYELITYRLMEKLKAENILHAEVYVSVGVCLWRKQDFDAIFEGLERGREARRTGFRHFAALDFRRGAPVRRGCSQKCLNWRCAIGIERRRHRHRRGRAERSAGTCFATPTRMPPTNGLRLTAHAGETAGPESVWGALNLRAERIGHGLQPGRIPNWSRNWRRGRFPWKFA